MPQTRQYASNAERQAAYRNRSTMTPVDQPFSSPPGRVRWRRLSQQAEQSLSVVQVEMQTYYDSRSERWQESDRAEEFQERLETLGEIIDQLREWGTA